MGPSENNEPPDMQLEGAELEPGELDRLLRQWKAPSAPAGLRQSVFPRFRWWRKFWNISIRIPLPVACCLVVLLAGLLWRWPVAAPNQIVQKETVAPVDPPNFQPVHELRPRIIKIQNAEN